MYTALDPLLPAARSYAPSRTYGRPLLRTEAGLAPCIALIGCDGSGKSTLTEDLVQLLNRNTPTQTVYLGLGSGDLGRKIGKIPLIGGVLEPYLNKKAKKTHDKRQKIPGLATALVMFAFSMARYRRFRQTLEYRKHGIHVVTDRYPQAEITGSFDGPGLDLARAGTGLIARLALRERNLYREMATHRPTLIFRLNVDADTAINRKPDHSRALLEKKIAMLPQLQFKGARIIDIDATRPYAEVRDKVLSILGKYGLYS